MSKRKPITSDRSISSHKSEDKEYLVSVKNFPKLNLRVKPNNTKSWLYRYNSPHSKKQKNMSLGVYPSVTFARACELWRENEDLLSQQIDPQAYRKKNKETNLKQSKNTFENFAWEHFESLKFKQKENTLVRKRRNVELVCSYIGGVPIDTIESTKMLEVLTDIQNNSLNSKGLPTEKAERCAGIASDIFIYASARGFCKTNPVSSIKSQLLSYAYGNRPAVVEPSDLAQLLRKIETLNAELNTLNSLRLLSMLYVRNGDLRRMKWTDLDLINGRWNLNPLKGQGKSNMVNEMIVPLPRQAIGILKEQYEINGLTEYVFYSKTAKLNFISENTANKCLKDLGYKDIHCVHGFRATARTILEGNLKYPVHIIEMALGHTTKDPNGNAYGRFQYYDERAEMMQNWADYLDALRTCKDTEQFKYGFRAHDTSNQIQALINELGDDAILEMLLKAKS
ncbi:tyrosine-type recombinase/integrase [Psychrobacter sp. ASPA161_9]|uniref:tyrosine-type recombinase/integrase n=1 Tax=Psychrobacter sp. ASPA161_9 TaxID=3160961 RepID=UPI003F80EDD9